MIESTITTLTILELEHGSWVRLSKIIQRYGEAMKNSFYYVPVKLISAFAFAFFILFNSSPCTAATHVVTQTGLEFSEVFLKMENNDTIKFVNLDTVNHRLIFAYKGRQEQLAMIKPGESQDVVLDKSGVYDVSCANHPNMKLTVYIPYVLKISNP